MGDLPPGADHDEVEAWSHVLDGFTKARDSLEDAIRVELGAQPVDRQAVSALWADSGGEDVGGAGVRFS